jgi:hypothetical protein
MHVTDLVIALSAASNIASSAAMVMGEQLLCGFCKK